MKTLSTTINLSGQTEEITMSELRNNPGDVFAQVQMGKVFRVTKSGKVIAEITKPERTAFELGAMAREVR